MQCHSLPRRCSFLMRILPRMDDAAATHPDTLWAKQPLSCIWRVFSWTCSQFERSNCLGTRETNSPMGRRRWTTRLTVEECYAVEIGNLVRAGAFEAEPGIPCSYTWNDSLGNPVSSIKFRVFPDQTGALAVHFYHRVPAALSTPERIQHQSVQITTTRCHFGGGRAWFRCSFIRDGYPCKRRVGTLYSTPHEKLLGCRKCHYLTYESAQRHDKRIDLLLKLPIEEFSKALATGTLRQRLLAVRASTARLLRMQRAAERFRKSRRNSRTPAVGAKTQPDGIFGQNRVI